MYKGKRALITRMEKSIMSRRSTRSDIVPQIHSKRNPPSAADVARRLQPIIPIPRDWTYSGITGPLIEAVHVMLQSSKIR